MTNEEAIYAICDVIENQLARLIVQVQQLTEETKKINQTLECFGDFKP